MNKRRPVLRAASALFPLIFASACGGSTTTATTSSAQVAQGMELYGSNCASCHGADGSGTSQGPAVVGADVLPLNAPDGAGRDVPFATAGDVFRWVRVTMPGDAPGSLTDAEYAAILAFDLKANGVDLGDSVLDEAKADAIQLH